MTASLHCGNAVHAAIAADLRTFARGTLLGYQPVVDEHGRVVDQLELRNCPHCHEQISRKLGIEVRLAKARAARSGLGDQSMIGTCKRALCLDDRTLEADDSAIRTYLDAVALEQLVTVADGPDHRAVRP